MFKVFLVDDEELIIKQIAESVPWMDNGFEVIGMETNSKKAVERVLELKPDVIFSDLRMPYLDGHTFLKTVRENGLDAEFVMLSAYGTFEDARTFFQQEGFDYLLKPLQIPEVQLVLEKLATKLSIKHPQKAVDSEEIVNPAFVALVEYVRTHFNEKFTLEQLGKKFALNPGYICNLFAENHNTTLTCLVTQVRMEHAVVLLNTSNFNLKQIANECGYKDYFYFNKVFKGYYGMAPSQYELERV
ncbi:response regulator transcription factor [Anaerovorax odorimutans]|uniref:response regulator transcription factor n=1 Tax=Anaerovorax odorimutans TaxID=109327 RepID=UPI000405FFB8|nr:response regulator [Anaerovorax odorimutans]